MKLLNLLMSVCMLIFVMVLMYQTGAYVAQYQLMKLKPERAMWVGVTITTLASVIAIFYFASKAFS